MGGKDQNVPRECGFVKFQRLESEFKYEGSNFRISLERQSEEQLYGFLHLLHRYNRTTRK